jgi:hypothetical protein
MAARAYWKGQIRLALVSIPVEIFTATKSGAAIAFNQIHEPTGKRIRYEKVVEGVGPVNPDEIVKGYQVEKGNYVLLEDEEIEAVKLESKKTLELTQFVDPTRSTSSTSKSPITWCRRTTSPRKPISCCARRCGAPRRWRSASWRCGAANISSA